MRSTSLFVAALAAAAAVANCDASTCQPTLALRGGGGLVEKVGGFVGGFLRTASFGDMSSPHLVAPEAQVSSGTLHLRGGEDAKVVFEGEIRPLMQSEGLSEAAIKAFQQNYEALVRGDDGMIAERAITPAADLPSLADIAQTKIPEDKIKEMLERTVVLKLNGGLGTGMGLEQAKSLLQVKEGKSFLAIIAEQVMSFRKTLGNVRVMFMNSFSTSADTKAALSAVSPEIVTSGWEVVQNKVPKIQADTLRPAKFPANPAKEWCPPGHGDLYPSLAGSGELKKLLDAGVKYMFVSNADNLGATLDLNLLSFFVDSDKSFIMEVCERTAADKKGGHLAVRKQDGQMLLRESAQCADEDEKDFQNTEKHRYFNTNNLWIRLDKLAAVIEKNNGVVPLPMIKNSKTVDPGDADSAKVFQLETAMGAAIESFEGAGAIVVGRHRFAPVKTCADLLRVRSDAYVSTEDHRLVLAPECEGSPPVVDLDKNYKKVAGLDKMLSAGEVPSLKNAKKLVVKGKVVLSAGTSFAGDVTITNAADEWKTLPAGDYKDQTVEL